MAKQVRCLALMGCLATLVAACSHGQQPREQKEETAAGPATQGAAAAAFGEPVVYNFDSDAPGKPPRGFQFARTGQGTEGAWVVRADPTAPSKPNVLAQTSSDSTDYRFPMAILEKSTPRDVAVSVWFKGVAGKVDQAGGIVFRYQDANNYYVARANALEDNLNLYRVVAGRRQQIAGASVRVPSAEWHVLRVETTGSQIKCYLDGALKIAADDRTFLRAGQVGLWTKADSVTYFDDLQVVAK